jgi:hypothetical protein
MGGVENEILVNCLLVVLVQYWPSNPVPVPMAELSMNEALATGLSNAPGSVA